MKKMLSIFSILCMITVFALAAANRSVIWNKDTPLDRQTKGAYEERAYGMLKKLGIDTTAFDKVTAVFEKRSEFHRDYDVIHVNFWHGKTYTGTSFPYPFKVGACSYWDHNAEYRDAPDTDKPVHSTDEQAISRAKTILRELSGIDIDKDARWRLSKASFVRKDWEFYFYFLIEGYMTPYSGVIQIADDKNLSLVSYINWIYEVPKVESLQAKIQEKEARTLADKYLNKYYHKHELKTLEFSTNRLEIVVPNYAFTPQEQHGINLTNAPVLVWKAIYTRKKNTLTQTPVYIYVDAADGSMLGGYE